MVDDLCTHIIPNLRHRQGRSGYSCPSQAEQKHDTLLIVSPVAVLVLHSRAGVREIHLHDEGHTCASLLATFDVHPQTTMRILRHSQISTTMEIYSHPTDEQAREALNRLTALLE